MIGQYHECIDLERTALACRSHGLAQDLDMVNEQGLPPVQQVDREEPTSAWNERTTIIRHETQDSTEARFVARRRITPSANPPYSPYALLPRQPLQQVVHEALQQIELVARHRQRLGA